MDLFPNKLPELSQNSIKIFESTFNNNNNKTNLKKNINNKNKLYPYCGETKNQKISYSIDNDKNKDENPMINIQHLEWLLDVLTNDEDRKKSHEMFMNNYQKILINSESRLEQKDQKFLFPQITSKAKPFKAKASTHNTSKTTAQLAITNGDISKNVYDDDEDGEREVDKKKLDEERIKAHDVRYYTDKIHNKKIEVEDENAKKMEMLKRIKKLVKKYPFERTKEENKEIFKILSTIEDFISLFPKSVLDNTRLLEELCGYAIIERVMSKNNPIFGTFGFYLVLSGSVTPVSVPYINRHGLKLRSITPELDGDVVLTPGQCFGTITELKDREISTRMFRVITLEDKCEFLKISIENYNKVAKRINEQEKVEKITTIKSCEAYSKWPKHLIEELMEIFEWRTFSPNTILTSEGYHCPFIGFIREGECHVLRKVDVPHVNKQTGVKEKSMKQVVVGKLTAKESFGEISVIMKEPMTCSIVTETECKIGLIPCEKLSKLEPITLRLLMQTNRTFADLNDKQIFEKYIEQQKNREWKNFKSAVVQNVFDKFGIVHGNGKYRMHHDIQES